MAQSRSSLRNHLLAAVGIVVAAPIVLLAIDYPLQSEQISEAYSLAQRNNHDQLAAFLSRYERDSNYPSDRPIAYVQAIHLQTPYEQIVLRAMQQGGTYSLHQAEEDYRADPSTLAVRVQVALRRNYTGPPPSDDDFDVTVLQPTPVEPKRAISKVLCDPYSQTVYPYFVATDCLVYTREIVLRFDVRQFTARTATVRVLLPNARTTEANFRIDRLK